MYEDKPLNKPFPSKIKGKKFTVIVLVDGKRKAIHFGATGYPDFRSGTATAEQRKSYLARAKGIRNKRGELTYKDKTTANGWSYSYLWKG
jgi:hypothetical protein